jgi:hypothetical protein|tara:strand:+ start:101 stop:295 length:195 start_codon:yes stop_codon:yes gene_type:complete
MPDEIITNHGDTKKIELTISEINFIYHMLDRFPIQGVETVMLTNNLILKLAEHYIPPAETESED